MSTIVPNPAEEITAIQFSMEKNETATVSIYSAMGQLISATTHQDVNGQNVVELNLIGLKAGTYFVKINTKEAVSKMIPVLKSTPSSPQFSLHEFSRCIQFFKNAGAMCAYRMVRYEKRIGNLPVLLSL